MCLRQYSIVKYTFRENVFKDFSNFIFVQFISGWLECTYSINWSCAAQKFIYLFITMKLQSNKEHQQELIYKNKFLWIGSLNFSCVVWYRVVGVYYALHIILSFCVTTDCLEVTNKEYKIILFNLRVLFSN